MQFPKALVYSDWLVVLGFNATLTAKVISWRSVTHMFPGFLTLVYSEEYDVKIYPTILNPFPNKPWFLCVCSTSLLKTLQEKEKLLEPNNFSFSHSVFYPFGKLSVIFIKFEIVVCKLFQFGRVKNLWFGKRLNSLPND